MPVDIFVYAIIAAGLVFWLRSILGTRHGDERVRSNPYLSREIPRPGFKDGGAGAADADAGGADKIKTLTQSPQGVFAVEAGAEAGLLDILREEKDFDIEFFLKAAREAYAIVVEAFAQEDRETLRDLLAPVLYRAFEQALEERQKRGEKQETEVRAVNKAGIAEARIAGKTAYITVRFETDETTIIRSANNEILSGQPGRTAHMKSAWVFGRVLRARDPRWLVYETREASEGES